MEYIIIPFAAAVASGWAGSGSEKGEHMKNPLKRDVNLIERRCLRCASPKRDASSGKLLFHQQLKLFFLLGKSQKILSVEDAADFFAGDRKDNSQALFLRRNELPALKIFKNGD